MVRVVKSGVHILLIASFVSVQLHAVPASAASPKPETRVRVPVTAPRTPKAQSSAPKRAQKWREVVSDVHQIGPKAIGIETYERIVKMGELEIPVAHVTHTVQKQSSKPGERLTPHKVAEGMRKTSELPPWMVSRRGDIWVFVSDHKAANRYLTLFYREHNGLVSISVSSIRRLYVVPVLAETEVIQRHLAQELSKVRPAKGTESAGLWDRTLDFFERIKAERVLPRAEAQSVTSGQAGILDLVGRLDPGKQTDFLNSFYNRFGNTGDFTGAIGDLRSDLNKFAPSPGALDSFLARTGNMGDRVLGQVDRAQGQWDRGMDIADRTVDSANRGIDAFERESQRINDTANRGIDMAKQQSDKAIDSANKIAKKMTSFETAFIMGLGGAIGAGLGTMVVNVVVGAGTWAVKSLWNAIFGLIDDETRKQINANTQDSLAALEVQAKRISMLELEIDKNIAALAYATNYNAEDLARMAGGHARQAQVAAEIETNKLKNGLRAQAGSRLLPGDDVGNPDECALKAEAFQSFSNGLRAIAPILTEAASGSPEQTRNKICRNISNLLLSWLAAEAELQVARGMVLDGMKVMMDEIASKAFRSNDPLASDRRTLIACRDKISDMKSKTREFDKYGCSNKAYGAFECDAYHRSIAAIDRWEQICKQTDETSRARDFSTDFMYVTEGLSHQLRQAQTLYEKLARANCTTEQCGEEGEFTALQGRYCSLLAKAESYGCRLPNELKDACRPPPAHSMLGHIPTPATDAMQSSFGSPTVGGNPAGFIESIGRPGGQIRLVPPPGTSAPGAGLAAPVSRDDAPVSPIDSADRYIYHGLYSGQ